MVVCQEMDAGYLKDVDSMQKLSPAVAEPLKDECWTAETGCGRVEDLKLHAGSCRPLMPLSACQQGSKLAVIATSYHQFVFRRPHTPSHTSPLTQSSRTTNMSNGLFQLTDIPEMGTGAVANTKIAMGQQILSEPPVFQVPTSVGPEKLAQFILTELQRIEVDKRKEYFALSNKFISMRPVEGIFKTNAIPLGNSAPAGGIFLQCSRFNHSCTANAAYHWNYEIGEERIYAVREICSGEQITVNYLSDAVWALPSAERKARICMEYQFQCNCNRCRCAAPEERVESDKRRVRIAELDRAVGDGSFIMLNPSKCLSYCREALNLLEEERESSPRLEQVYYDAFQICVCHGDLARASRFAFLATEQNRLWQGQSAPGFAEMEALVGRPESHRLAFQTTKWLSKSKRIRQQSCWTSEIWLWSRAG